MKLHRVLTISAISTVLATTALAASPAAFAAPADTRPTLKVELQHAPVTVAAGGTVEFDATVTNTTGQDAVFLPFFALTDKTKTVLPDQEKLSYRFDQPGETAQNATALPWQGKYALVDVLGSLDQDGNYTDDSWTWVEKDATATIHIKLSLTKDVAPSAAVADFFTMAFPADADGNWTSDGEPLFGGAPELALTITAPQSESTSPSASVSASTSATAGTSVSPAASAKPATSAPAPAKPASGPDTAALAASVKVQKPAKSAVTAAKAKAGAHLASTGGGDDSGPIAAVGAAAVALGVGTLVALRRRRKPGAHA